MGATVLVKFPIVASDRESRNAKRIPGDRVVGVNSGSAIIVLVGVELQLASRKPGPTGADLVNARLPKTVETGSAAPMVLKVGGRISQPRVTLAVK